MSYATGRDNQRSVRSKAGFVTAAALFYLSSAIEAEAEPAASEKGTTETPSPAPQPSAPTQQPATPSSPATAALTSPSMPPTTAPPTTKATPGTIITTADSEFGEILFDDTGQAIYLFDKEETTTPECYDECTDEWPPVLAVGTR